jgi:hypothetical protein
MSYRTLPMSFWGYALETTTHLLNLVPSKTVSKIPSELWTGRRPSMRYIHIWRCPAHVLKGKAYKLESKTEVCLFLGCPKGTRGYSFYSPKEMKVFVATNARFLKEEYVNNNRPKSEVILDEMVDVRETTSSEFFEDEVVVSNTPQITVDETPSSIIPRRSGRIVRALDRFIGIANVAISDEFDYDPSTYNKVVSDVDADQWVIAMKSELESMYSNNV